MTEKQLTELQKDKKRLDWLADPQNNTANVLLPTEIVERNIHSLRAAIDDTMELEQLES